jgi:hypothetical protein
MERFLYRLAKSKYAAQFILKGALMLRVWQSPESRPTMDVDLLGITSNDEDEITAQIREILSTEVEPDGLHFDTSSIKAERITEDADYQGLRIRFRGTLGSAKVNMQLDIGFGDVSLSRSCALKVPEHPRFSCTTTPLSQSLFRSVFLRFFLFQQRQHLNNELNIVSNCLQTCAAKGDVCAWILRLFG